MAPTKFSLKKTRVFLAMPCSSTRKLSFDKWKMGEVVSLKLAKHSDRRGSHWTLQGIGSLSSCTPERSLPGTIASSPPCFSFYIQRSQLQTFVQCGQQRLAVAHINRYFVSTESGYKFLVVESLSSGKPFLCGNCTLWGLTILKSFSLQNWFLFDTFSLVLL